MTPEDRKRNWEIVWVFGSLLIVATATSFFTLLYPLVGIFK